MAGLKVFKELQLPQETEINSIYLVSSEQSETVDIFITGNQSGTIKRIRNAADIESIIDQKLLNYTDAIVYAGYIDLNVEQTGPSKLNSLFIVENNYQSYLQNDVLLKVSNTQPYFIKINGSSSGGSSENFTVIDWIPYREDLLFHDFEVNNESTHYVTGVMSKVNHAAINLIDYNIGQPNSTNIHINNGSGTTDTTITVDVVGSEPYGSAFGITDFSSIKFAPLDVFDYNNDGSVKGSYVNMIIFQLENDEQLENLTIQDIMAKPRRISITISGLYQPYYNEYTTISWDVVSTGVQSYSSGNINVSGNPEILKTKISNGILYLGQGHGEIQLELYDFDSNKRYASLGMLYCIPENMDVNNPFSIGISAVAEVQEIKNAWPDYAELVINDDAQIFISARSSDYPEYFQMNFSSTYEAVTYAHENASQPVNVSSDYIDNDRNIRVVIDGNNIKLKNNLTDSYDIIYTNRVNLTFMINPTSEMYGDLTKSSWNFNLIQWSKVQILDGILPDNSIDGSTIRVTANGTFNGKQLLTNDIVRPYNNKTDILIQRNGELVSSDVLTAGDLPVSGNAVINYAATSDSLAGNTLYSTNKRLEVKLDSASANLISDRGAGLFASIPAIFYPYVLREQSLIYNNASFVEMDVSISSVFVINYQYAGIYTYFANLGSYDVSNQYNAVSKVITIIIVNALSVTWPPEILWADSEPPTLSPNQYLVVTGIHVKSGLEESTGGKVLCTYSYFNR